MFLRLSSTYKSFCLVSLFSLMMISGSLSADVKEASKETTHLDGLVGPFPIKFRHIIDQLKKSGVDLKSGEKSPKISIQNRLLLYGPTGNGKTTIAKKIAELGEASCIYKTAFDLKGSGSLVDEGAVKIKQTFKAALELADKNKQPVVIIFDGLEKITANKESLEAYLQSSANDIELSEQLDSIDNDARIFFIGIINGEDF